MKSTKIAGDAGAETRVVILELRRRGVCALTKFANEAALTAASLTAIGAFEKASVGWFDFEKKTYKKIEIAEQCEVLSAIGDVAIGDDGKASLHVHVVLGPVRRHDAWRSSSRGYGSAHARGRPDRHSGSFETKKEAGPRHRPDQSRRDQEALISVASSGEGGYSCVPRTIAGWGEGLIRFTGENQLLSRRISRQSKSSAGVLAYRQRKRGLEVLLVHPGGPYLAQKKDDGAWSIPKGGIRHVGKNIQSRPPAASSPKNSSGGLDRPVAGLGRGPPARRQTRDRLLRRGRFRHNVASQRFLEIEWPPSSGRIAAFPEVDRAA